jgi:PAS domain S-box-containing protein
MEQPQLSDLLDAVPPHHDQPGMPSRGNQHSDGELRDLLAQRDWSQSALGPVGSWPESLRTAVSICLSSRFPILLWWGPELIMIYNDAYRPILGGRKHPAALGAPGRTVWPEVWDVIGPMLDQVMSGEGATWSDDQLLVLDRNGYLEECYFTFSYSPIPDESGGIGGVFCAVTETTDRVVGERRLTLLATLAAELGEATDRAGVCGRATEVLARNRRDHPVAVVVDVTHGTGALAGSPSTPGLAALDEPQVREVVRTVARACEAAHLPVPDHSSTRGIVAWHAVPVLEPGQDRPTAVLVVGLGEHREWDAELESYVALCATHVGNALSGIRALEAERRRTKALAELDEVKSDFFTNVSHELRTPLTLIAGPVREALADDLSERQRDRLAIVERNTVRLTRMVDAMLDFARMEAGRVEPDPSPVDVAELTRTIAAGFKPAIERAGLRFVRECRNLHSTAHLDRDMYERIVLNLLSNALKYTPEGEITLRLLPRPGGFELSVSDTGIGIHEQDLLRVFQRFEQLPRRTQSRSYEGAGIGLAMVKQLTELMGGTVAVRSEEGVGSTFVVRLPFGAPATEAHARSRSITPRGLPAFLAETQTWDGGYAAEPAAAARDSRPHSNGAAARPRLVVAEDNADMRAYLRDVLADEYDLELVGDGRAAVEAAQREPPDIVLADVMMPRLDGYGVVRALRTDPHLSEVPIVLVSAKAGEEATSAGLGAGADDYLVKPFSVLELRSRLTSNLERARSRMRDAAWRRAVMGSLHDAVVISDLEGRVLEVNDSFTRMLGWRLDDGPFRQPFPWWPSNGAGQAHLASLEAVRSGRAEEVVHPELELVHRDGRPVWATARSRLVEGRGEQPPVLLSTLRDVTREHDSRARRMAAARLSADFGSAHDLDDVLTAAVVGFAVLFTGVPTIRATAAGHEHVFTTSGAVEVAELEPAVAAQLRARDPVQAAATEPVPGLLLVPDGRASECRVWVQFDRPRLVTTDERIVADLLAEALALAWDRVVAAGEFADREAHLARAIESHRMIGQAIGILVERHRTTPADAFELLKRASQDHNTKLREVAQRVIETAAQGEPASGTP